MAGLDIYTWGWGKYGQLGQGDERNQALPRVLDRVAFKGATIKELSCGFCYNVAVRYISKNPTSHSATHCMCGASHAE